MTSLIESTSTETLPSGTTITTLHLSAEGRSWLSVGDMRIPALPLVRVVRRRWWPWWTKP